jgi:hypothetical protein
MLWKCARSSFLSFTNIVAGCKVWDFHGIENDDIVTYLGFSIHDGTLLHSKSQYTTVKHSRKLLEHTYTSDPHGLGTPAPTEFFQQGFLWQSSNTHFHPAVMMLLNTRRAIGPLALHNGTSAYTSLTCNLPAPTIGYLHRPRYKLACFRPNSRPDSPWVNPNSHWLVHSKSRIYRNSQTSNP